MIGKKGKSIKVSDDVHLLIKKVQMSELEKGIERGLGEIASELIQSGVREYFKDSQNIEQRNLI